MSCILYSRASYNYLAQSAIVQSAFRSLGVSADESDIANFLFNLNVKAYCNRYSRDGEISLAATTLQAQQDEINKFTIDLSDIDEVFDTLRSVRYQCADVNEDDPIAAGAYEILEKVMLAVQKSETAKEKAERIRKANEIKRAEAEEKATVLIAQLRAENPWAIPAGKLSDHARAAKNLKKELSLRFPGAKFSITTKSYSGGNSLRVSWTDGPSYDEVNAIASRYEAGSFDGMNDLYTYDNSAEGRAQAEVFSSVKYVSVSRDYSPDTINTAADLIEMKWGFRPEVYVYGNSASIDRFQKGMELSIRSAYEVLNATNL